MSTPFNSSLAEQLSKFTSTKKLKAPIASKPRCIGCNRYLGICSCIKAFPTPKVKRKEKTR